MSFSQGPASPESQALRSAGAQIQLYPEIIVLSQDIDAEIQISEVMVDNSAIMSKTFTGLNEDEEYLVKVNTVIDGKVVSSVSQVLKH